MMTLVGVGPLEEYLAQGEWVASEAPWEVRMHCICTYVPFT